MAHLRKIGKTYYLYWREHGKLKGKKASTDYQTALKLKNELERRVDHTSWGMAAPKKTVPWKTIYSKYIEYSCGNKEKSTQNTDERVLRQFTETIHPITLDDFNVENLERYRGYLRESRVDGGIARDFGVLKNVGTKLVDWGYADKNPIEKVKLPPKKRTKVIRYLSEKEIQLLLNKPMRTVPRTLIRVGLYTGMRIGEILHLMWDDIKSDEIVVQEKTWIERGVKRTWKPETHEMRVIPLLPELKSYLIALRKERPATVWVFERLNGELPQESSTATSFKNRVCLPLGITNFTAHGLRHTFAAYFLFHTGNLHALQKILGHASISTTERNYHHLIPNYLNETMKKLSFSTSC